MTIIIYWNIMKLDNTTVLITGADRGMGLAFAKAALAAKGGGALLTQQVKQGLSAQPGVYLQARE